MKESEKDRQPAIRAARRPGWHCLALAAVGCAALVASACASQAPPRAVGRARPQPRATAAARPSSRPATTPAPATARAVPRCQLRDLAAGVSSYQVGGGQSGIVITLTNT